MEDIILSTAFRQTAKETSGFCDKYVLSLSFPGQEMCYYFSTGCSVGY